MLTNYFLQIHYCGLLQQTEIPMKQINELIHFLIVAVIKYMSLGDTDSHLLQTIGICYLLPTCAAQQQTPQLHNGQA
jgi:hypothetical protein